MTPSANSLALCPGPGKLLGRDQTRGLARTVRTREHEVHAVVGVDLDVAPGGIVGFLGPDVAGRTSTLRMLSTLREPVPGTGIGAGLTLAPVVLGWVFGVRRSRCESA